jgi:hypothetical protein
VFEICHHLQLLNFSRYDRLSRVAEEYHRRDYEEKNGGSESNQTKALSQRYVHYIKDTSSARCVTSQAFVIRSAGMNLRGFIVTVVTVIVGVGFGGAAVASPQDHGGPRIYPTALLLRDASSGEYQRRPSLREATGRNTYLTSVATQDDRILVSTTFHGIYESVDGGDRWSDLGEVGEISSLYRGDGFYEDIGAVAYDPTERHVIWVEYAQDGRILAIDRRTGDFVDRDERVGRNALDGTTRVRSVEQPILDEEALQRRERASEHTSFYLSPWQLDPERLAGHMEFAKEHGFTAVVIDFKDDLGRLVYDSALEPHRSIGAVHPFVEAERIIETVHEHGLYLIARVVVFKDRELYLHDRGRYALWDARRDAPWGVFRQQENDDGELETVQVEYWVDPFSEFVWDYNVAVAKELETLGVDEIQFDYIRTPADGRTADIRYRYRSESPAMLEDDPFRDDRVEALSAFLSRARAEITIPIGIDVFGFNGWYRMSYLGQDIALLARYVDVISPMLYPSHFPREFLGNADYLDWAEQIYREGVARGRRITDEHVIIRPYIQAFLIGGELEFELPTYTDYLKRQIRGSVHGGASGFTLWNNSGRYYMVARGLWYPDGPRISRRDDE